MPLRQIRPIAAQGGDSEPPSNGNGNDADRERNLLLSLIVQYPAVRGSFAVAAGFFLHIDPLGTLKWDSHDALIGVCFAILPSLLDMIILLPDWEPARTTRTMKLKVPRAVAEKIQVSERSSTHDTAMATTPAATATATAAATTASAVADPPSGQEQEEKGSDLVEVERVMTVRADQHPLRDALLSVQMSRVISNIGRSLSPGSEALLLTLVHISEEMLYRGILLVLVVRWITDNLYYAGMEESVLLPGGVLVAPPQLGALLGGVGMTAAAVGLLVQRELFPIRLLDAAKEQLQEVVEENKKEQKRKEMIAALSPAQAKKEVEKEQVERSERKKKFVGGLLERLRVGVVVKQRWIVGVEAAVELLQWSTLSASFLLTGNILAPIAGSMANDVLYSALQRFKHKQIRGAMAARAQSSNAKKTADLLLAVREYRENNETQQQQQQQQGRQGEELPKGLGFPQSDDGSDSAKEEMDEEESSVDGTESSKEL